MYYDFGGPVQSLPMGLCRASEVQGHFLSKCHRPGFQIDLFFQVFLLDLFLTRAFESTRIVRGIPCKTYTS